MRTAIVGLTLAAVLGFAPAATAEAYTGFKLEMISALFKELGATDMSTEMFGDEPRITFKIEDVIYAVDFYGCKDSAKGCRLLQFNLVFEPDPNDTVQAVNDYNMEYVYGKAALGKKEGLVSSRTVDGTIGSSKEQVIAEFQNFLGASGSLLDYLKKSARVASAGGGNATLAFEKDPFGAMDPRMAAKLRSLPKNPRR